MKKPGKKNLKEPITSEKESLEARPIGMDEVNRGLSPNIDKCDLLLVESVEFQPFITMLIRRSMPDMKIELASDGLEASIKVGELRPRIVWTELRLPRMSGFELIELIRQNPNLKNTKIIVSTAYGSEDVRSRALEMGVFRFLRKPYKIEEALSAIADCLLE